MEKLTEKEKRNLLVRCGRETAESMIESAVTSAENPEQMSNQIFTIQVAAQAILATCAYNMERLYGENGNAVIDLFCKEIKSELEMMKNEPSSIEMLECKNQPERLQ